MSTKLQGDGVEMKEHCWGEVDIGGSTGARNPYV